MMKPNKSVHEPEAELLSAEDAIQDAKRLKMLRQQYQFRGQSVPLCVPLEALLEAIESLEIEALRRVAQKVEECLEVASKP